MGFESAGPAMSIRTVTAFPRARSGRVATTKTADTVDSKRTFVMATSSRRIRLGHDLPQVAWVLRDTLRFAKLRCAEKPRSRSADLPENATAKCRRCEKKSDKSPFDHDASSNGRQSNLIL